MTDLKDRIHRNAAPGRIDKRVVIGMGVMAIVVLGAAGLAFRVRLLEEWYLLRETHAAVGSVLAIVGCIDLLMVKIGPNTLTELNRVAADPSFSSIVRNLGLIEIEKLKQSDRQGDAQAAEKQLIEDLLSSDRTLHDAALVKAESVASQLAIPTLLDLFLEDASGPSIGSLKTKEMMVGYKAIRAIIDRRKEAVVPALIDTCLSARDGGVRREAACLLRETGTFAGSAIPMLESALHAGDDLKRCRAAEALEIIRKESK